MGINLTAAAAALWDWLPAITTVARAVTALIGLVIAGRRVVRWWRARR